MAVGPSDDSIATFTAFTSLPRENAIAWLQANSNDVEKAVNAFFVEENPFPPKPTTIQWNESEFHADKSGDSQQNQGPNSFTVNHQDTLNPNVFGGAPSRPPSRVSTREGRAVAQEYVETEDEQMHRAMAISLSESQTLPGQETGVTNFEQSNFRPAQRDYYDSNKWAVTIPGSHAQEILLNPEPFDRKREPGTPAFLKPALDAPRLSALIKILHEIPVAREALLNADILAPNYGRDNRWWDGEPIKQLRVVNVDQGYQGVHNQDLVHETQRLMAFLDGTERGYGSVEGLLRIMDGRVRIADNERVLFLEAWRNATSEISPDEHLRTIFESRGVRRGPEEDDEKYTDFDSLAITLGQGMIDNGFSLYNALDEMIWEGDEGVEIFLKDIGNVVIFDITCSSTSATSIGIDIPATWYPDRYLESSIPQARKYRERQGEFVKQRDELNAKKEKLLNFKTLDATSLLVRTATHLGQTWTYRLKAGEAQQTNESMETDQPAKSDILLEQLKTMIERIANKIKALEQTKERLTKLTKENSLLYTQPTDDPETCPTHKYTLRGVATTPSTCYVLEKRNFEADGDLIALEDLEWQWWKLEYVNTDARPVVTTVVSEEDVLKAARTESRTVLLVYADEFAVNYEPTPLPSQLANFVRTDNLSFQAELDEFTQNNTRESPGKRKAVADDDNDDMITEHGRSPPFNRDDQFNDDDEPAFSQPTSSHLEEIREEITPHFSKTSDLTPSTNTKPYKPPPPPPPRTNPFRPLKPKRAAADISDDKTTTPLRSTDPFDRFESISGNHEMQQRLAGTSFLHPAHAQHDKSKPGRYAPDVEIDDRSDFSNDSNNDDDETLPPPPPLPRDDLDPASGRGAQGEMW